MSDLIPILLFTDEGRAVGGGMIMLYILLCFAGGVAARCAGFPHGGWATVWLLLTA